MSALDLGIYEIFKHRFSGYEVARVIEYFEEKAGEKIKQKKDVFMTKDDKVELIIKAGGSKTEMISLIESSKTEIFKWVFIFWLGQLSAVAGILLALFNFYFKK